MSDQNKHLWGSLKNKTQKKLSDIFFDKIHLLRKTWSCFLSGPCLNECPFSYRKMLDQK